MKAFLSLCLTALLLTGCATNSSPATNTTGPRNPLADPAENTLNSPTTGPSSAGLPGGPIGSRPNDVGTSPLSSGRP